MKATGKNYQISSLIYNMIDDEFLDKYGGKLKYDSQGMPTLSSLLKIPAVAIGGINSMNAKDVLSSRVTGLAVSSYLCASEKPYDDALKLMEIINERV